MLIEQKLILKKFQVLIFFFLWKIYLTEKYDLKAKKSHTTYGDSSPLCI